MDYENNYRELRATIEGRIEGYEGFLSLMTDRELETVKTAEAKLKELKYLAELLNKQKQNK